MRQECFDEGTIQAFLDGELAADVSLRVSDHVAACGACALLLAEAEEETATVFAALEREFDALVPTRRLWTKINDSLAEERKQTSRWQRFWTSIAAQIANPSIAVAAGVLIVLGFFALISGLRSDSVDQTVARVQNPLIPDITQQSNINPPLNPPMKVDPIFAKNPPVKFDDDDQKQNTPVYRTVKRENNSQNNLRRLAVQANYAENSNQPKIKDQRPKTENLQYLPGEESYVKTIVTLTQTVEGQKENVLRPSARVAFERDLAVVDDAIKKMKTEVRKNPRNDSAKRVLYSSYQNKIDLLNSVAERNELMASLK